MRAKAGWFAALLYLFCVLAPGAALAVGDAAACLVTATGTTTAAHMHGDSSHRHHAAHTADAGAITHDHAKHDHSKHDHSKQGHDKASPGACCAILCVSAIVADLPAIAKPSQPISAYIAENFERLPSEAPPLLYRPPIA